MTPEEWTDIVGKLEGLWPSFQTRPPEAWDPYREHLMQFTRLSMMAAIDQLLEAGQKFAPTVAELVEKCQNASRYQPRATTKRMLSQSPEARYAVDFPRWCVEVLGAAISPEAGTLGALQGLVDAGIDTASVADRWAGDWVRDQFYLRRKDGNAITVADD